jgi:glycosyltransferase involved in cell wall biosynthesis
MKRVVVSPHDPAEFLGGTERVVDAMVKARIRRGEEIVLFAGSERFAPETSVEQRGEPGVAVHRVLRARHETGEVFLRPSVRSQFDRLLAALEPDVVEWHHGATLSLDLIRAAREQRVKTVLYLHDLWLTCPRYYRIPPAGIHCPEGDSRGACVACVGRDLPWSEPDLDDWVRRFTRAASEELSAADVKIAPSKVHAERIQSCFPSLDLDIRVVPHGLLDAEWTRPAPAPRAEGRPLRLVHFGNLVPEKGLLDLAAALGKLADPGCVTLDLYGRELTRGLVAAMGAVCPNVKITHHGPYAGFAEIAGRVAEADVAVFPSRAPESYGLVVDEALAAGVPVVVSDRGALSERAGSAGLTARAEDPEAWYLAIGRLVEHPYEVKALRGNVPVAVRTIENALDEADALEGAAPRP